MFSVCSGFVFKPGRVGALGASEHPSSHVADDLDVPTIAAAVEIADVIELDSVEASPLHELARARRQSYERSRQWQDSWAARMPWAESVFGLDGKVRQVRCKVCSDIEGRNKLLVPKLDSLWKHCGRRKATTSFGKVKAREYYFLSNNIHVKNDILFP